MANEWKLTWKRPHPGVGAAHGYRGHWTVKGKGRNWNVYLDGQKQQSGLNSKKEAKRWAEDHDEVDQVEEPAAAAAPTPQRDDNLKDVVRDLALCVEYLAKPVWLLCKHLGIEEAEYKGSKK